MPTVPEKVVSALARAGYSGRGRSPRTVPPGRERGPVGSRGVVVGNCRHRPRCRGLWQVWLANRGMDSSACVLSRNRSRTTGLATGLKGSPFLHAFLLSSNQPVFEPNDADSPFCGRGFSVCFLFSLLATRGGNKRHLADCDPFGVL